MIPGRRAPSLWFTLKLPHAQVESKDTALERIKMKAANCSVPEKCWNRESFSQCNSLFPNKVCTAWKEDGKPPAVVFVSILALDEAVWFPERFALLGKKRESRLWSCGKVGIVGPNKTCKGSAWKTLNCKNVVKKHGPQVCSKGQGFVQSFFQAKRRTWLPSNAQAVGQTQRSLVEHIGVHGSDQEAV
eukprot:491243-Pelagomonas_calceolata.AAC.2